MMSGLLKIIVIDQGGEENIFNEIPGEVEHQLDLAPKKDGEILGGFVRLYVRTFKEGLSSYEQEIEVLFFKPRRLDIIYGSYE